MHLLADNNLTQHVHETITRNNVLDLVTSTPELIVNLKIIDEIGDHQAIQCSIKIENGNMASEKKNTTLEEQISMQCGLNLTTKHLVVRNNAELAFEILKNRVNEATHPKKTSHHQQSIVDEQ